MDDLQPGDPQRIGPYWLEGRLASGGMGRVYLGRSPGGRPVAVKVIRAELAQDAEFLARFAREVAAARKVSGIYTADVVDAGLQGPMPWLAEGLAAIHAAGVVHRDLKPPNVLLAEDGPRLIDFGISRSMEMSALTRTGMVIGSPGFMSPEQAQGRTVGPPSDIFSISTRQGIVTGLQTLSPAGLPSGAQLISTLTTAMQHSIAADRHYQNWMADFAASGSGCGADPGQNPEYAVGQDASAAATKAKGAFLDLWNPMAPRYGQQTYASTDF